MQPDSNRGNQLEVGSTWLNQRWSWHMSANCRPDST